MNKEEMQQRIAELQASLVSSSKMQTIHREACQKAEAELTRRDKEAGEPVYQVQLDNDQWVDVSESVLVSQAKHGVETRVLFTAAQPAAGEPVAYMHHSGQVVTRQECTDERTFAICCKVETPLYTAAQPSALPPEVTWMDLCKKNPEMFMGDAIIRAASYNQAIADAKALGSKPIKLPDKKMQNIFSGVAVAYRIPCKDAERRDNEWVESLKTQGFTVGGE